ncbi:hypothetical protein IEQ34_019381 [Dendrobium chrysotoxum]|uniref:Secreted protein n=1 Tax=Dendrobium chrysotoxum TaxID=161865 RepID=A0AAV7G796_DENCH|nr:hypothetical protein IEQ34_019381 [Dendrobium chrysotoxum]
MGLAVVCASLCALSTPLIVAPLTPTMPNTAVGAASCTPGAPKHYTSLATTMRHTKVGATMDALWANPASFI